MLASILHKNKPLQYERPHTLYNHSNICILAFQWKSAYEPEHLQHMAIAQSVFTQMPIFYSNNTHPEWNCEFTMIKVDNDQGTFRF